MDVLKLALICNVAAIIIVLVTAGFIAWENTGSRNLVIATGTLLAAMILFITQLSFELRRSISYDQINIELTIDRAKPEIREWKYNSGGWRIGIETSASSWLANNNSNAFNQDREKLTVDMAIFSLISFLTHELYDWQLKKVIYSGKTTGTLITTNPVSKDDECSSFDVNDLTTRLSEAGNLLAGGPLSIISGRLCLPPKSTIKISARSLIIENRICQMVFNFEPSGAAFNAKPGTGGQVEQLPGGGSRYETRQVAVRVMTTFFALRSHHWHGGKYREWCSRVIGGAGEWFES